MKRTNTKKIEGIGTINFKDVSLCYSDIGLYIPITEINATVKEQYEKCKSWFKESFEKENNLHLTDFTLFHDISLHINLDKGECSFSVSIILWVEDENGEEIKAEFYDPFPVEIKEEDAGYIKGKVIQKLTEVFFK